MPTAPNPGPRIRAAREGKGMTQVQLATAAGIAQGTLSRIEITGQARGESLHRIAQILEVSIDSFFAETAVAS